MGLRVGVVERSFGSVLVERSFGSVLVERSFERGGGGYVLRRTRSSHPWSLIWTPPGWQVTRSIE